MRKVDDLITFVVPKVKEMLSLNLPELLGPPRPVAGHVYLYLYLIDNNIFVVHFLKFLYINNFNIKRNEEIK